MGHRTTLRIALRSPSHTHACVHVLHPMCINMWVLTWRCDCEYQTAYWTPSFVYQATYQNDASGHKGIQPLCLLLVACVVGVLQRRLHCCRSSFSPAPVRDTAPWAHSLVKTSDMLRSLQGSVRGTVWFSDYAAHGSIICVCYTCSIHYLQGPWLALLTDSGLCSAPCTVQSRAYSGGCVCICQCVAWLPGLSHFDAAYVHKQCCSAGVCEQLGCCPSFLRRCRQYSMPSTMAWWNLVMTTQHPWASMDDIPCASCQQPLSWATL